MKWIIAAAGALAAFLFAFASDAGHGGPHEGDGATVYAFCADRADAVALMPVVRADDIEGYRDVMVAPGNSCIDLRMIPLPAWQGIVVSLEAIRGVVLVEVRLLTPHGAHETVWTWARVEEKRA